MRAVLDVSPEVLDRLFNHANDIGTDADFMLPVLDEEDKTLVSAKSNIELHIRRFFRTGTERSGVLACGSTCITEMCQPEFCIVNYAQSALETHEILSSLPPLPASRATPKYLGILPSYQWPAE